MHFHKAFSVKWNLLLILMNSERYYSRHPWSIGDKFQHFQWIPESMDDTKSYTLYMMPVYIQCFLSKVENFAFSFKGSTSSWLFVISELTVTILVCWEFQKVKKLDTSIVIKWQSDNQDDYLMGSKYNVETLDSWISLILSRWSKAA
jgi:hypothetical protein